jgi:signal transduction histidine kinase
LTIIRGEAQVTLRMHAAAAQDYQTTLHAILEQAVNLSRLVEDLLLLTRAEMNQLALAIEPVLLLPMIESEVFKWRHAHTAQSLEIDASAIAEGTCVMADKPRIQQVLSILIDNAVKYSPSDSVIRIKAERISQRVKVSVIDHGPGIPAPHRESIFERFVRFNKQQEGLGLGLPIAKVMVESHGGTITLEASSSEGSTFSFTLPEGESV